MRFQDSRLLNIHFKKFWYPILICLYLGSLISYRYFFVLQMDESHLSNEIYTHQICVEFDGDSEHKINPTVHTIIISLDTMITCLHAIISCLHTIITCLHKSWNQRLNFSIHTHIEIRKVPAEEKIFLYHHCANTI